MATYAMQNYKIFLKYFLLYFVIQLFKYFDYV